MIIIQIYVNIKMAEPARNVYCLGLETGMLMLEKVKKKI